MIRKNLNCREVLYIFLKCPTKIAFLEKIALIIDRFHVREDIPFMSLKETQENIWILPGIPAFIPVAEMCKVGKAAPYYSIYFCSDSYRL